MPIILAISTAILIMAVWQDAQGAENLQDAQTSVEQPTTMELSSHHSGL